MRVVSIAGFRGSGKTTLIQTLISKLSCAGKRSAVIVNEEGEMKYDSDPAVPVAFIRGG